MTAAVSIERTKKVLPFILATAIFMQMLDSTILNTSLPSIARDLNESPLNMQNAINIGMFPDIPLEKFHYIGNSSLSGAYTMLLSKEAERKTYQVASNMTYLELSTVPTYMDEFVAACFIPHTDTSMFPSVSQQ